MSCTRKTIWCNFVLLAAILWQSVSFSAIVHAGEVPSKYKLGESIVALESLSSLSLKQRKDLAGDHMKMGELYTTLARSSAILTVEAAEFYARDQVREWGAEYFGALAAMELGRTDRAIAFATKASRLRSAPPILVSLCAVLGRTANSAGSNLSWANLAPSSYYDSLESAYQLARIGAVSPAEFDTRGDTVVNGLTISPLLLRWRLTQLLIGDKIDELRPLLRQIESNGLPLWRITSSDGTAVFSDPPLVRLIARAHYLISESDLARAAGMVTDKKSLEKYQAYWVRLCFRNRMVEKADSLLKIISNSAPMLPYRGWVAAQSGDNARAAEYWDQALKIGGYKVGVELLRVWRDDRSMDSKADGLRESLLTRLGGMREQARLQRSMPGKIQLMQVYSEIGAWYFARGIYDSASSYWGNARVGHDPVGLQNYGAPFCAGYSSARALSGAPDYRQEGYEGFNNLLPYFPAARSVIEPLEIVFIREDAKLRE